MDIGDNIELVIFDVDDVLTANPIKKLTLTAEQLKPALAIGSKNIELPAEGLCIEEDWISQLQKLEFDVDNEEVLKAVSQVIFTHYSSKSKIYPQTPKIIKKLAKKKKLVILSNNSFETIKFYLGYLLNFFSAIKTYPCVDRLKPDAAGLSGICKEFKIDPGKTLFVGNSLVDVMAAKDAGAWMGSADWGEEKTDWDKILSDNGNLNLDSIITQIFYSHEQLLNYFNLD